jgi:predicted PurR-regulated permease PerM
LLISQLLPVLAKQLIDITTLIGKFFTDLPSRDLSQLPFAAEIRPYIEQIYQAIDFHTIASQLQSYLQIISSQILSFGGNLWTVVLAISNGLMNLVLVLIIVFFMTVDENAVEKMCLSVFPKKYSGYISDKMSMIKESIGHWIRGQFNVSVVAAIMTFIGLAIFGVQYSLTLAVVAGIMMVIPVFGRVFAWLFSLPIVFNQSPALALWLTIYYFLLSQVENNFMIPYLMNKAVGLSPLIIIFAMLVGSQFLGILGLIMAIPVATVIALFVKDYTQKVESR